MYDPFLLHPSPRRCGVSLTPVPGEGDNEDGTDPAAGMVPRRSDAGVHGAQGGQGVHTNRVSSYPGLP